MRITDYSIYGGTINDKIEVRGKGEYIYVECLDTFNAVFDDMYMSLIDIHKDIHDISISEYRIQSVRVVTCGELNN